MIDPIPFHLLKKSAAVIHLLFSCAVSYVLSMEPHQHIHVFLTLHIHKNNSPGSIFSTGYGTISLLPLAAKLAISNSSPPTLSYTSSVQILPHYYTTALSSSPVTPDKSNSHVQYSSYLTHQQQFRTDLSILYDTLLSLGFQNTIQSSPHTTLTFLVSPQSP